jgi:hypothetical protein
MTHAIEVLSNVYLLSSELYEKLKDVREDVINSDSNELNFSNGGYDDSSEQISLSKSLKRVITNVNEITDKIGEFKVFKSQDYIEGGIGDFDHPLQQVLLEFSFNLKKTLNSTSDILKDLESSIAEDGDVIAFESALETLGDNVAEIKIAIEESKDLDYEDVELDYCI